MTNRSYLIYSVFTLGVIILLANSSGVPQGVTKAPGEPANSSCATCHTPAGNYNTTITLEVLNSDNTPVTTYNLGETYAVKVQVSGTNNPRAYGFQMSCQDSLTTSDLGVWSEFGERVKQQNFTILGKQRKYIVQSAAKTDGIFTAKWKAPSTNVGKVKFYFAGLAVNLNGSTSGDNNVFGQLTLQQPLTSSTDEDTQLQNIVYPNPSSGWIQIDNDQVSFVQIVSLTGQSVALTPDANGAVNIQSLPNGVHIIHLFDQNGRKLKSDKIVKI